MRDRVDVGIAPAAEHVVLLVRQLPENGVGQLRLLRRADKLHRRAVQTLARRLAVRAEIGAHKQFVHRVAEVSQPDAADGADGVGIKRIGKIIGHSLLLFQYCRYYTALLRETQRVLP